MYAIRSYYVFSDMKHDHMRCWQDGSGITTYRRPSNKGNGNAFDRDGRLLTCEHATSRLVREERDGSFTVLVITSYSIHYTKLYEVIRREP